MVIVYSPQSRNELKHHLCYERKKLYGYRFLPECAFCGEGIEGAPDMHEVLFTRGDVAQVNVADWIITQPQNCVLVHPGGSASPCHSGATSKDGQRKVIRYLIRWCGYNEIAIYIQAVRYLMKGNQASVAQRLLEEIRDEMQGLQQGDGQA